MQIPFICSFFIKILNVIVPLINYLNKLTQLVSGWKFSCPVSHNFSCFICLWADIWKNCIELKEDAYKKEKTARI